MLEETYNLSNGVEIPKLGLGTWFIDDDAAVAVVRSAVDLGYRHMDTAQAYRNEAGVGEGVRTCGLPREQIFVTSKIAAEAKSYDAAMSSIDESLSKMGLDYIDLMIIHSPQPWAEWREDERRYFDENKEVWRALEDAYSDGKVRAIGVSNFLRDDLDNILADCRVKPMVNQVLAHIGNTPLDLIEFCQADDILVEAYSPIAHGQALECEGIVAMAEAYGVSVPQLCIRYVIQLGMVALPKTANSDHMKSNSQVGFKISVQDMEALKNLRFADYGEFDSFPVFSGK